MNKRGAAPAPINAVPKVILPTLSEFEDNFYQQTERWSTFSSIVKGATYEFPTR